MNKSHLLINEPPLLVSPSLAQIIGLNEAIILQQVHYWLSNPKAEGRIDEQGVKWIYNTYEQWQENFPFWNADKIQRIFLKLEELGVIISAQLDAKKRDMTKFYHIDYDKLCMLDDAVLRPSNTAKINDVKMNQRLPETTTSEPTKKGDLVDGLLHFGQVAKERKEDKVEEVIQTLERGLHVNITRSLSNQTVARRILKDGRPVETWLSWVKSDEWRAARLYIYADLEKVWRDYPQAFESVEKKEYTRLL